MRNKQNKVFNKCLKQKKSQQKFTIFTFNIRVSFYCNYKRIRALIFAIFSIYKSKLIENSMEP